MDRLPPSAVNVWHWVPKNVVCTTRSRSEFYDCTGNTAVQKANESSICTHGIGRGCPRALRVAARAGLEHGHLSWHGARRRRRWWCVSGCGGRRRRRSADDLEHAKRGQRRAHATDDLLIEQNRRAHAAPIARVHSEGAIQQGAVALKGNGDGQRAEIHEKAHRRLQNGVVLQGKEAAPGVRHTFQRTQPP